MKTNVEDEDKWNGSGQWEYPRLPTDILVNYTLGCRDKMHRRGDATAINIGAGGLYLWMSDLAPSDVDSINRRAIHELELEFNLSSDNEIITMLAEIRWRQPLPKGAILLGIKFLDMRMKDRAKVLRCVVSNFIGRIGKESRRQ